MINLLTFHSFKVRTFIVAHVQLIHILTSVSPSYGKNPASKLFRFSILRDDGST